MTQKKSAKKIHRKMRVVNVPEARMKHKPISPAELDRSIQRRISAIQKEFVKGFNLIKQYDKSVTFFGSARVKPSSPYYKEAVSLAAKLAEEGYAIVTGGGPGIMEAANRGAQQAGGDSIGLNIKLPHEQRANPYQTASEELYYFFVRKVLLSFSAEAFVYFPGGFGTMDEFFEIITLVQTNKIRKVPLILFGSPFWNEFEELWKKKMYDEFKAIDKKDLSLFHVCDNEDEVVRAIKKVKVVRGDGN